MKLLYILFFSIIIGIVSADYMTCCENAEGASCVGKSYKESFGVYYECIDPGYTVGSFMECGKCKSHITNGAIGLIIFGIVVFLIWLTVTLLYQKKPELFNSCRSKNEQKV